MKPTPNEILESAAKTFKERNAIYGDNWSRVGAILKILFPNGVRPDQFENFHLVMQVVTKLSRFANTDMTHQDSIHDICVYAAILESLL